MRCSYARADAGCRAIGSGSVAADGESLRLSSPMRDGASADALRPTSTALRMSEEFDAANGNRARPSHPCRPESPSSTRKGQRRCGALTRGKAVRKRHTSVGGRREPRPTPAMVGFDRRDASAPYPAAGGHSCLLEENRIRRPRTRPDGCASPTTSADA